MDTDMIACMQNVIGCFVQYVYQGAYSKCAQLFSSGSETMLNIPEQNVFLEGHDRVKNALLNMEHDYKSGVIPKEIYILNSPAFQADAGMGKGTWGAFTFKYYQNNDEMVDVEPSYYRFDCDFIIENDRVKIRCMDWYQLMNWQHWKCRSVGTYSDDVEEIPNYIHGVNAEDFVQVEKLVSRFTHSYMEDIEMIFSKSNQAELYLDAHMSCPVRGCALIEKTVNRIKNVKESDLLRCVPYTTAPVIFSTGDHISGRWLTMSFDSMPNGADLGVVVRRIGMVQATFKKENGDWKILRYKFNVYDEFQSVPLNYVQCLQLWRPAVAQSTTHATAQDVFQIQNLISEWVERLKIGRLQEFLPRLMSSQNEKLLFWLGDHEEEIKHGYEEIAKDCLRMDNTYQKNLYKTTIIHSAMTPLIELSEDGTWAYAQWMDQCCTDVSQLTGDYSFPFPAMISACKYQLVFHNEDGMWKLMNFKWNAWGPMGRIYTDPRTWSGWVANDIDEWPMPLEKYELIKKYYSMKQ